MNAPDWREAKACGPDTAHLFFPANGDSGRPAGDNGGAEFTGKSAVNAERAKAICCRCPVRQTCLEANLHEPFGIFGGLTPRERRRLARSERKAS